MQGNISKHITHFTLSAYGPFTAYIFIIAASSCSNPDTENTSVASMNADTLKLFTQLDPSEAGINFRNDIIENKNSNPIVYEYTYNGAGVAVGDINNDELDDIFFTANQGFNKLYLNKGGLKFEDITDASGAGGRPGSWKAGVTMADVNADGLMDIYVCYSGDVPGDKRANELLINRGVGENGIPVFQDEALKWNIADSAYSTQSCFFDYDKDGDLDMILINHAPHPYQNLDKARLTFLMNRKDLHAGTKLYQNTGNSFKDVTSRSGIINSSLSFGLGVSVADINNDNWPDVYISNDYMAEDYLYINNRNGTFTNRIKDVIGYTSEFSMGNDIGDFNNDGWNDIYTLDMLPESNYRQKILWFIDNLDFFKVRISAGLNPEFQRNMLHVNNRNNTFSEIGQLSGVSNTDWSWCPLIADFDNDGWNDLFITNGFVRDYTNLDFLQFMDAYLRQNNYRLSTQSMIWLSRKAPSSDLMNYVFKNNGDLTFSNMSASWGMDKPSVSNGAAYTDLDRDGDLDLVVNNTNQPTGIYRNNTNEITGNHYLLLRLKGEKKNTLAIGARIFLYCDGMVQSQEQLVSRGYQSSVSPLLHIGLEKSDKVDSLQIVWPSGKTQWLKDIAVNSTLQLNEADADGSFKITDNRQTTLLQPQPNVIDYTYRENNVNDFKRQLLLTAALSYSGPCMTKGDINADGLEDIFVGGASGYAGKIFIQNKQGQFVATNQPAFIEDAQSEDSDACFAEVDNDGDPDLYVSSGGYDLFTQEDAALQDRLYLNDGKGKFTKAIDALPAMLVSKSCVAAADINADGFVDFFAGGRVIPGRYPETPQSFLLLNDGKGNFKNIIYSAAEALELAGMITSAVFVDLNTDNYPDLVAAGEFMPIQVWMNHEGRFTNQTNKFFTEPVHGFWNEIVVEDINSDGQPDIIAGNLGLNSQLKCSDPEPAEIYFKDFDNNGTVDPILCYYIRGKSYPAIFRDELIDQIGALRTRITNYKSYANARVQNVFTSEELQNAGHIKATSFASACFISTANGKYQQIDLPLAAQRSPIYAIGIVDVDGDQIKDIIIGGNVSHARLRFGYCWASKGQILKGRGNGEFEVLPSLESGLQIDGDIRSISVINRKILFGVNNQSMVSYGF